MMEYKAPHPLIDLTDTSHFNDTTTTVNQDITGLQCSDVKIRSRYGSALNYPRDIMTMAWKRYKRSGHQASKYSFNISLNELVIDAEKKPEKVRIVLVRRRRRYACESRPLQKSFSSENKYMIVYPGFAGDKLTFNTTFFKDPAKEQFDNKEWTLLAEEVTKKGKVRPLAAVQLNFAFFVNQSPDVKTELKLKLRCLQKEINNCTLSLIISSTLVKEGHAMNDNNIQTQAPVSSIKVPFDISLLTDNSNEKITKDFDDWKKDDVKEGKEKIAIKSLPPPQTKQAWDEALAAGGRSEVQKPSSPLSLKTDRRQSVHTEHKVIRDEDINKELLRIAERIKEIEILNEYIKEKLRCSEENSEDEQKYMIEHMKLLNEKDALVRKQDYFNVAAEMSEVKERLEIIEEKVNAVTTMNDIVKTEEKQRIDNFVKEYISLIDRKNELAEILTKKEAEEKENAQFGRDTLERLEQFLRESKEPMNTSQRIFNWIKLTKN